MQLPTLEEYEREFAAERAVAYPDIDAFEKAEGFAVDREDLEQAARVLACPIKRNPPSWQHGRVLYAAARRYLREQMEDDFPTLGSIGSITLLDIGTAKGFSALMLQWAALHAGLSLPVVSVDVIDPRERVQRNSPADLNEHGLRTLAETIAPWPEAHRIMFVKSTGRDWLRQFSGRIGFCFIDGKHSYADVAGELSLLANLQKRGDMAMLDDLQIEPVRQALADSRHAYTWREVEAIPLRSARLHGERRYAVAVRR